MEKVVTNTTKTHTQPDLVFSQDDENMRNFLNDANVPMDAKVMATILKTTGVSEYDSKVINQMLEFAHHYLTDILLDADDFRQHASKVSIDLEDVKLAIYNQLTHSFTQSPPRQTILEMARSKNKQPLPTVPTPSYPVAVNLPSGDNMALKPNFQVEVSEEAFSEQHMQPQGNYIELFNKRFGRQFDHEERLRKKVARQPHRSAKLAKIIRGLRAKLDHTKRRAEKVEMKKAIKVHKEKMGEKNQGDVVKEGAIPAYLLDRQNVSKAKILSSMIKQKRSERAGKWNVPLPKVKPISQDEVFRVIKTGSKRKKAWKRMITKVTFVPDSFVRAPPKYERMIRPSSLRFKKANVTHPDLKVTLCLKILGVKKNPQSPLYTNLGVITKGTVIEVDVSEMGIVTQTGRVVWGKYAQVTNNPENDGCINSILLV